MKQAKEFFLRRIAVVLAVLMVVVMLPIGTPATATETVPQEEKTELAAVAPEKEVVQTQGITADGLEYEVYSDHIEITDYTGNAAELVIPSEIEGLPVTEIGWDAFEWCTSLTSVIIPDSVKVIDDSAFANCSNLTNLVIPDSVIEIGYYAFGYCTSLKSITIPSSVTYIGWLAFDECSSLTSITVDEYNPEYCSVDGILYSKDMSELIDCPGGIKGSIDIPNGVTYIDGDAFNDCKEITSIIVPGSVNYISDDSFANCTSLNNVTLGYGIQSIGDAAFYNCTSLSSISIPNTVTRIGWNDYEGVFQNCTSLTSITLPSSLETLGNNVFRGCTSLKTLSIPNGVTSIGYSAFANCSSLTSITFPSSISEIYASLFSGCTSLTKIDVDANNTAYCSQNGIVYDKQMTTLVCCPNGKSGSIVIPGSVTNIGGGAFSGCEYLTSISIPDSVTTIGGYAFENSGLTSVSIPDSVTSIGYSAFQGCKNLTSINIPNGVTTLDQYTFSGCSSLKAINIPSTITEIGYGVFSRCSSLNEIKIPDSVTWISPYAFSGCSSLTDITIPDSLTYIGHSAFTYCSSLKKVALPENFEGISWRLFDGCNSLSEITIPETVTYITYEAFVGCDSLSDVYYGGSKSGWEAISIGHSNEDLTNATIHYAKVDTHDTLNKLTELDYLLFSEIAYSDSLSRKIDQNISEILSGKWSKEWQSKGVTYAEAYGPISNWVLRKTWSYSDGFSAALFMNESNEAVLSFCGSRPINLDNIASKPWDMIMDWVVNDLAVEILSMYGPQVNNAIYTYIEALMENPTDIRFTGHSLGGALADIASAYSGYEAISFNAISALDVAYNDYPREMSKAFTGVDEWNFTDHTNEHDILAGMFEEIVDDVINSPIKPYQSHKNTGNATDIIANHGLASIVEVGTDGYVELTRNVNAYHPNSPITHLLPGSLSVLHLGTTRNDSFIMGVDYVIPKVSYGGNGNDHIVTSILSDTLIGGKGDDFLDGDYLNDTYIYYKGDGHDHIHDISGNDSLYLYDFSSTDVIEVVDDDAISTIQIKCNGETIIDISKFGREYTGFTTKKFKVHVYVDGMPREFDITSYFNTKKYGSRILVGCPVSVEVLDPTGNVVYTLTDGEVGSWYTDYGNFHIFEEANGEYGKVLDLVEGYTARIVGADEGTMDVTYQVPVDGELTDPVSVSGVPVTENLSATIEETEDGDVYLVIDEDSDGEVDSERKLYGECPFTDVPDDSFYYTPVLWAVDEGITTGATETTFNPNGQCQRAQVVTFLWRAAGCPEPETTVNPFLDVKESDFYYKAVLWAVENGITNGLDATHFGPFAYCNRAQVVTFLYRAMEQPEVGVTECPFTDVQDGAWYEIPVLWAVENGVTNGMDATTFGVNTTCNRAQVVTFLYRAFEQ